MNPETLALFIPILALSIPIVAIMSGHQRKMAELMQRQQQQSSLASPEVHALRGEVAELKDLVRQQTIMLDDLIQKTAALPAAQNQFKDPLGQESSYLTNGS